MNKYVKHCVLMKIAQDTTPKAKALIFKRLDALPKDELGIIEMVHGPFAPSLSGPSLSRDYTDGLVVTFRSLEDRNHYNDDPEHKRILTENILPNVKGGADGLLRFDFEQS
jgi:Stress responsive A/B Barrel Domain